AISSRISLPSTVIFARTDASASVRAPFIARLPSLIFTATSPGLTLASPLSVSAPCGPPVTARSRPSTRYCAAAPRARVSSVTTPLSIFRRPPRTPAAPTAPPAPPGVGASPHGDDSNDQQKHDAPYTDQPPGPHPSHRPVWPAPCSSALLDRRQPEAARPDRPRERPVLRERLRLSVRAIDDGTG